MGGMTRRPIDFHINSHILILEVKLSALALTEVHNLYCMNVILDGLFFYEKRYSMK